MKGIEAISGTVMSCKPDCFLQVMTVITTLKPELR